MHDQLTTHFVVQPKHNEYLRVNERYLNATDKSDTILCQDTDLLVLEMGLTSLEDFNLGVQNVYYFQNFKECLRYFAIL